MKTIKEIHKVKLTELERYQHSSQAMNVFLLLGYIGLVIYGFVTSNHLMMIYLAVVVLTTLYVVDKKQVYIRVNQG